MKKSTFIALILLSLIIYSCQDSTDLNENNVPVAVFSYSPNLIDTSTTVIFTAVGSSDIEDSSTQLQYSWDLKGDMHWTESTNSSEIAYKYLKPGTYTVKLKVIDTEGWSGEEDKTIIVHDSI